MSLLIRNKSWKPTLRITLALGLLVQMVAPFIFNYANAATLSNTYLRLDRLQASTATTSELVFKSSPSGGTFDSVVVTFPSQFTVNATQTVSVATCPTDTGASALGGTLAATGDNTAHTITITGVTGTAASTLYCVDFTSASSVTTPSAASTQYQVNIATLSSSTPVDSTYVSEYIISSDQVTINASVPASFTFSLSGNSDTIPAITSGSLSTSSGVTFTITTNASKGWIAWVRDASGGLVSAAAGKTIATTGVGSASHAMPTTTEDYTLQAHKTADAAGGGTVTIDPNYIDTAANYGGGLDNTKLRPVAQANGTAGGTGDQVTLKELASAAGDTPAASDYTDTLTIVGAGNF